MKPIKQGLVNVPSKHQPIIGDTISNKYPLWPEGDVKQMPPKGTSIPTPVNKKRSKCIPCGELRFLPAALKTFAVAGVPRTPKVAGAHRDSANTPIFLIPLKKKQRMVEIRHNIKVVVVKIGP